MCQITIERQLEAVLKVGDEALKSKESAIQFLKDAGIYYEVKKGKISRTSNKKTIKK